MISLSLYIEGKLSTAKLTLKVLEDGKTGHIYVPKNVRKYKIMDLAKKYKKRKQNEGANL